MGKKKSLYSVKDATAIAFKQMPEVFHSYELVSLVRGLTARPGCMDGTIMRRLRDLRDEMPSVFNYRVIHPDQSIYRKTPVTKPAGKQLTVNAKEE